ncbi:21713_t:CDS:2 [Racocetra persica]|uniref:21713_t:CDS:1 n=1 Tax=Racocetra persica TaxID=160502 RepID=A0ACA9NYV7_9GLOM|nr:21713_t:CDS:2 [Racocetra persica]
MARLVAEIGSFSLTAPLEAICSESIFYLTMNGDEKIENEKKSGECFDGMFEECQPGRAILSRFLLHDIEGFYSSLTMESGYNTIIGLKALKALNINQESLLDFTQEEIANNIRILKMKLSSPMSDADENLYGAIKKKY